MKYTRHDLLTGCAPVPQNNKLKRNIDDWKFYKGWEESNDVQRCIDLEPRNICSLNYALVVLMLMY